MKKTSEGSAEGGRKVGEPREEYEFAGGRRGKYSDRVSEDAVMVALDPDVAEAFPTAAAVNRALRGIIKTDPKPSSNRGRGKSAGS